MDLELKGKKLLEALEKSPFLEEFIWLQVLLPNLHLKVILLLDFGTTWKKISTIDSFKE